MLLIQLTPIEARAYSAAGDCPPGDEQNVIELVLAAGNLDAASLSTLGPILGEAAQRARAIITDARRFEIVEVDNPDEPRYRLSP